MYREGANTAGKQRFTSLYSRARKSAFTERNIRSGWAKTELLPFDPNRVLRGVQRPPAELAIPPSSDIKVALPAQDAVLQTPVTSEALTLLRNESRSRASVRSAVIGTAKVMSYEDLVQAQKKRDAKDAGRGGRSSRKHQAQTCCS